VSNAAHALAFAGIAVSAAAALVLWLAARRRSGRLRSGYLWLGGAAALWCLAVITEQAVGSLGGVAVGLTIADLPPLLALIALVIGVILIAAADRTAVRDGWRARGRQMAGRPLIARLADGYVLAAMLFAVGWVTLFGPDYARAGTGPGDFAVQLLHPVAGLVVVGVLLPVVCDAGRRAVLPFAALLLATASDALGVGARLDGGTPGAAQQAVLLVAFCVLGLTPLLTRPKDTHGHRPSAQPGGRPAVQPGSHPAGQPAAQSRSRVSSLPAAAVSAAAVAAAVVVVCAWALAGGHGTPALVLVAGVAVLALATRLIGVIAGGRRAPQTSLEAGHRFRELAHLTSDAVLVCERGGIVRYASPAIARYGYSADGIVGTRLEDLIHPEDRPGCRRAVVTALAQRSGPPGRFPCRVRAADGTWRHVESTVSPYRNLGGADQLLVTARDVSDQVALRRQVTHLTFHDGLTGLPNRAYLEECAATVLDAPSGPGRDAGAHGVQAGVIFLDLDGFTAVNDSVGHRGGGLLIAQAARRLRATVPAHETVVRWGGDEFAVLIEGATGAQEIVDLAERLARAVAVEPFAVARRDISLTASVGVAFGGSDPPSVVLRNADVAMARAKESGGGRVEVFAAQMHEDVVHRLELTSDLKRAIADGQLVVEYQPVVQLDTSTVSGAEALVRWWRGGVVVPPGEFLGVAEESGLIVPLGGWVLRQACRQAAQWSRSEPGIGVSVNFSPRQVSADDFPESVLAALGDSGLAPQALTLEVTERVLVEASGPVVEHLAELRRAGVRLAIDDFGTGYASLAYLRGLTVDIIKIDRSFVAGLGEDETLTLLTRTIIQLGRDLGISVVAEGIESSRQLGMLRDMGCGLGQGYLVAAPMAAAEVESLIRNRTAGQAAGGAVPADPGAEAVVSLSET
jgi:diguanylate cyclase (GGDEF)-like protein/PAS domain S-box-containing protein